MKIRVEVSEITHKTLGSKSTLILKCTILHQQYLVNYRTLWEPRRTIRNKRRTKSNMGNI